MKHRTRGTFKGWVLLPVLLVLFSCAGTKKQSVVNQSIKFAEKPDNIIFLIGDGMALSQVSAGIYWKGVHKSIFERFKVVGFHKSFSHNDLVTDSAAGATAFSCGARTDNGAIGVLPPDEHRCTTILEEMDSLGWSTGIVVTCSATHATPASFIAHQELRSFSEEIALDFLDTELDCLIGGGEGYFDDRPDKKNLLDTFRNRGYVVRTGTNFKKLPLDGSKPFMQFTAEREPPTASAGRQYLPQATTVACEFLEKRSQKGFFLMVEGSQIDWACHSNDRNWLKAEMLDFDKTITKALEYADSNGKTLVIVTGDHECGGLGLTSSDSKKAFLPKFSARMHTGALVPVFAYGPGAEQFMGIYDNTAIYSKIRSIMGLNTLR